MTRQNAPRDDRTTARRNAEVQRRLHALETSPRTGPWFPLPLAAGYSAARDGAYGQGYQPAYRIDGDKIELRGTVQKGTGAGGTGANGFADGDVLATLPPEVSPAETGHGYVTGATTGAANSHGLFKVTISASGAITWRSGIAAAPGWIALDDVDFYRS